MDESRTVSVVLADCLALVGDGLAALCESHPPYYVAGQCGDGTELFRLIESLQPAIAVLDLELPSLFALEIVRKIRVAGISTKCVVLARHADRKTVLDVLRGGAQALVLKTGHARHLFDAFQCIRDGGIYVAPQLELDKIFVPAKAGKNGDLIDALSARERQVFNLLIDGLRAKEIACRLELSPKTVDTYRASLMRKLNIHDVAGLVKFAIQRNLTSVDPANQQSDCWLAAC